MLLDAGRPATSHYEVLGVAPDVGHEELRRAYVERALAYHPDRVPEGAAPDAAARAEYRMRELNAAWEVLRDPKRRTEYDRSLAPVERSVLVDPLAGAPLPDPLDPTADQRPSTAWWALGPALALGALLLLVLAAAMLGGEQETRDGVEVQTGARYEPGMCVAVRPGPVAEIVPCDRPSSGKVVEVQPYPRQCTDGRLRAVALPAEDTTLCLETMD